CRQKIPKPFSTRQKFSVQWMPLVVISLVYKSYYTILREAKADLVLRPKQSGRLRFDFDGNKTKNSTCEQVLHLNLPDFYFTEKMVILMVIQLIFIAMY
ncbi:hypothetical protein, partial [Pseudolactococcus laudensis]|uniref:hypothetical protein n=1 Tax=Pseudolactococcus laudensis TaxID=1494461 RepID=UPI003F998001